MTPRPHNGAMDTRASSPTFVGRRTELGRFETALAAARAGHPGVMVIAGEAGVGKTRLVAEFAASARASEARVLEGGCVPVGTEGLPFEPLIEALRGLSRELPEAALDELMGPGRAELARLMPQLVRDHGSGDPRPDGQFGPGATVRATVPLPGPACRPGSRRPRHRGCPLGRSIQSRADDPPDVWLAGAARGDAGHGLLPGPARPRAQALLDAGEDVLRRSIGTLEAGGEFGPWWWGITPSALNAMLEAGGIRGRRRMGRSIQPAHPRVVLDLSTLRTRGLTASPQIF